jgi:formylmethanofuran dehydrogenase subunit D
MSKETNFTPNTKWKPFYKMTFMDYEFTVNGKNIEFCQELLPQQLGVAEGDKFVVHVNEYGQVILVRE